MLLLHLGDVKLPDSNDELVKKQNETLKLNHFDTALK
jgi:hypothetical protein